MLDQIDDKDNDNGECLHIKFQFSHQGGQGLCQVRLFCTTGLTKIMCFNMLRWCYDHDHNAEDQGKPAPRYVFKVTVAKPL